MKVLRRRLISVLWTIWIMAVVATAPLGASPQGAESPDATVHGVVRDGRTGEPIAGCTILVVEFQQVGVTDHEGRYELSLPPGQYSILVTASAYQTAVDSVDLGEGQDQTLDFSIREVAAQFGEELVELGSRSVRTALQTPAPVDVVVGKEMRETGMTETGRIIQFLVPSVNFSTSTISDGTDVVRPFTLRGLGPDQTLVLINGKRRHNSALVHVNGSVGRGTAGVDVNAIPESAIDRVEILRDGAAAQHGSDAIAGVMNVILRQDEGTEVSLYEGETYEGDGEVTQATLNHGWEIGSEGFLHITAEYRDRNLTDRSGPDPRQQYPSLPDGSPDPREATFDRYNHLYGDPDSENAYLFLNASLPVGDGTDVYAFGGASRREGRSAGFFRRALDPRTVPEIHPDGFLPYIESDIRDFGLTVGVAHELGRRWKLDTSVTAGRNTFQFDITNSNNVSLGTASPTSVDAGTLSFEQTTLNVGLFGTLDVGRASPLALAFGAEVRRDEYGIDAGEPASWIDGGIPDRYGDPAAPGIQLFPGFRPQNEVDASRNNVAVYADTEVELVEGLLLGVATRFEDYSDFGNKLSGKLAARYSPADTFAIRTSVSTGFRAPSLHQAYFNTTNTQFVLNDQGELVPFEVGTFPNDSGVTGAFGVPDLKEESSVNYSLGFTSRPREDVSLSVDAYQIDIQDRIVLSGVFQAESDPDGPIRQLLEPFGVNAAQFFTNAIDTQTRGVDLVAAFFREVRDATVTITAAANWNHTKVRGGVDTPAPLHGLGEVLFDRIERERIEHAQPRERYILSGRVFRRGFTGVLRINRFGSVKTVESADNPEIDQTFSPKWLTDLELSYRLSNGIRVALGGNNLLDVTPDKNRAEISFNGVLTYPRRAAPFGYNGGFYYTRLSWVF